MCHVLSDSGISKTFKFPVALALFMKLLFIHEPGLSPAVGFSIFENPAHVAVCMYVNEGNTIGQLV